MVDNVLAADLSGSQHLHMFFQKLVNSRSTASNMRCRVAKRRFFMLPNHAGAKSQCLILFPELAVTEVVKKFRLSVAGSLLAISAVPRWSRQFDPEHQHGPHIDQFFFF